MSDCPFCSRIASGSEILRSNDAAVRFTDAFPVTEGHVLIGPRRHLARLDPATARREDLKPDQWIGVFGLVQQITLDIAHRAVWWA